MHRPPNVAIDHTSAGPLLVTVSYQPNVVYINGQASVKYRSIIVDISGDILMAFVAIIIVKLEKLLMVPVVIVKLEKLPTFSYLGRQMRNASDRRQFRIRKNPECP